ncbi:MAG: 16S rRNA (guanine(527)-N(7))-methyltransferase RsmG [Clostridia bacterium]|nr:16S rRNA (guanine(527)-N(7))-methyltransferase RsmG [Clostridia bacterium]
MNAGSSFITVLKEGARELGLSLNDIQVEKFLKYMAILKEWNEKMNLTAIEDDHDVVIKHFIDSLSILPYMENKDDRLVDIGTGAGFPGIPVKIVYDSINVTLLDSLDKRIKFLNEVISAIELKGIFAYHGRAEEYGAKQEFRENFDIATARAVANLPVLLEYCLPFVKTGGYFIAMKGSNLEEVHNSQKALKELGGEIQSIKELNLPFSDIKRNIIIIKKLRQTPTRYPRKAGKPSKEPLI